jgi:hypothetical protein
MEVEGVGRVDACCATKQIVLSCEGAGPSSERTPTRLAASDAPLEDYVEKVFLILMWSRVFS